MSTQLFKSPFAEDFVRILGETKNDLTISSPYINEKGVNIFANSVRRKSKITLNILTNLSVRNIVDDVTQPSALLKIYDDFKETKISSLSKLHAKVYVIDELYAIVTSANLTYGGIKNNFEYGVLVDDSKTVSQIKDDILGYAKLGNVIDKLFLKKIYSESRKIEKVKTKAEYTFKNSDLAKLLSQSEQKIKEELLVNRINRGKTINGIFSDTILYLLAGNKSLTTAELNSSIQSIHPDICDNAIDRVIGGQHFGKLWKHAVRNAQFSLKKKGLVSNRGNRGNQIWFLTRYNPEIFKKRKNGYGEIL